MARIVFDPPDDILGLRVSIASLSGEVFQAIVQDDATMISLKQAVAAKLQFSIFDFQLIVIGCETVPCDSALVGALPVGETEVSGARAMLSMCIVKTPTTLESYEAKGLEEWIAVTNKLQNKTIDDHTMLSHLSAFLDKFPALINWQSGQGNSRGSFKALLSFAVDSFERTEMRQQCVDELIQRGARIHIRHSQGFLIEQAQESGSAFVSFLEQKSKDFKSYEKEAVVAWRQVSSKLCGETSQPVNDEDEMTRIVGEFCTKYPEMVNFQNNHAVDSSTDVPRGYFAYAPLITFAGGQHCRRRRGGAAEGEHTRKGAVQELLRHGARVDTEHGGRTSMDWMMQEGSLLVDWFNTQLSDPMPALAPFNFDRGVPMPPREEQRRNYTCSVS